MVVALSNVLAFGWQPEIRGISSVLLMFVALCGAVYLLLGTNIGWRLGFLVAFAGFFGWMFVMGSVWWVYGIGLQGKLGSWQPVEIIQDGNLANANSLQARAASGVVGDLARNAAEQEALAVEAEDRGDQAAADRIRSGVKQFELNDWIKLPENDAGRGQAQASADAILVEEGAFTSSTEYIHQGVFRTGGETYPDWFFNFWHTPHYNLVQVQPVVPQRAEPGQAPPRPIPDLQQAPRYVLMVRDLGYRRRPAALITIGSGIIFGLSAVALHRRDKLVAKNRGTALVKVG